METWATCKDHNEKYMISNFGNVWSYCGNNVNGKIMKPLRNRYGYMQVQFYNKGKNKKYTIHSLVMYYFYGPRPKGLEIDHINRIPHDNRISNLKYCTHSENNINKKKYRSDIIEKDAKKRHLIITMESHTKIRKNQLCLCGRQREFRFSNNTNSGLYIKFLKHLKSKRHRNFMNNFLNNG